MVLKMICHSQEKYTTRTSGRFLGTKSVGSILEKLHFWQTWSHAINFTIQCQPTALNKWFALRDKFFSSEDSHASRPAPRIVPKDVRQREHGTSSKRSVSEVDLFTPQDAMIDDRETCPKFQTSLNRSLLIWEREENSTGSVKNPNVQFVDWE